MVAGVVLDIFEGIGSVGTFVSDNWQIIGPIVEGVAAALTVYYGWQLLSTSATKAAAAAQWIYNAAMNANPAAIVAISIGALIVLIGILANKFTGTGHIAQSVFGMITGGINVVIQYFKNWGLTVADIFIGIWNAGGACATNVEIAFHNAISHVQALWYNMLSTALTVVSGICSALNKLPFVDFDYSGITGAADNYASKAAAAAGIQKIMPACRLHLVKE